jgi:hypothetical protein
MFSLLLLYLCFVLLSSSFRTMDDHWLSSLHNSQYKCGVEQCFAGKLHFCILMEGKKNGELACGTNRTLNRNADIRNIRVTRGVTPCIVCDWLLATFQTEMLPPCGSWTMTPKCAGSRFLRNTGACLLMTSTSHSFRLQTQHSPAWGLQIADG